MAQGQYRADIEAHRVQVPRWYTDPEALEWAIENYDTRPTSRWDIPTKSAALIKLVRDVDDLFRIDGFRFRIAGRRREKFFCAPHVGE